MKGKNASKLRHKYKVEDWIINRDTLCIGDMIAFYCSEREVEIQARVYMLTKLGPSKINYREIESGLYGSVDFYENIVYKIDEKDNNMNGCTCGAKHTSNPNHHLFYCKGVS